MRVADPHNATGVEQKNYGVPNTRPQPWAGFDSTVDVVYTAAGNGTRYISDFASSDDVPMVVSAGKDDQFKKWKEFPSVVRCVERLGIVSLAFWMEDLGHTYPCIGTDYGTGISREVLFKRFFDHYLKPDPKTAADVFIIYPRDGCPDVDSRGESRVLPPDELLPEDMKKIRKTLPVTVRFLEAYSLDEIASKVRITRGRAAVKGEWKASMKGTCFSFTPASGLEPGKKYRITVPRTLVSLSGLHPSADFTRDFTVR